MPSVWPCLELWSGGLRVVLAFLDGYIFDLADAPALSQPIRRPADAVESDDTAGLEEVNRLYVDGLGAFYTDRWDRAVEIFRQLVARQRDYKDAAVKLEQARQQQQLALRYTAAREATEVGDWAGASSTSKRCLPSTPPIRMPPLA